MFYNKANAKISDRQASKEKFRRRMNRRDFMKSNTDQSIAQRCGDGKKDVQSRQKLKYTRWWFTSAQFAC